jgi:hypothetical protein
MPTNKNALTRYKFLDEMLSDRHHFYDIHDLTEKCNARLIDAGHPEVTQRCIEKDINYLDLHIKHMCKNLQTTLIIYLNLIV